MGKIEVTVGAVSFSGEGDPEWLSQELDKVLKAASELPKDRHPTAIQSSLLRRPPPHPAAVL